MWGIILLVSLGVLLLLIIANLIINKVKKNKSVDNKKGE